MTQTGEITKVIVLKIVAYFVTSHFPQVQRENNNRKIWLKVTSIRMNKFVSSLGFFTIDTKSF